MSYGERPGHVRSCNPGWDFLGTPVENTPPKRNKTILNKKLRPWNLIFHSLFIAFPMIFFEIPRQTLRKSSPMVDVYWLLIVQLGCILATGQLPFSVWVRSWYISKRDWVSWIFIRFAYFVLALPLDFLLIFLELLEGGRGARSGPRVFGFWAFSKFWTCSEVWTFWA